jgi:hypothetical protein
MDRRVVQATQLLTPLSRQPTHGPRIAALATSLVGFPVPVPPLLRLSALPPGDVVAPDPSGVHGGRASAASRADESARRLHRPESPGSRTTS